MEDNSARSEPDAAEESLSYLWVEKPPHIVELACSKSGMNSINALEDIAAASTLLT